MIELNQGHTPCSHAPVHQHLADAKSHPLADAKSHPLPAGRHDVLPSHSSNLSFCAVGVPRLTSFVGNACWWPDQTIS
eukprot:3936031-Rhodomonas_salina.1